MVLNRSKVPVMFRVLIRLLGNPARQFDSDFFPTCLFLMKLGSGTAQRSSRPNALPPFLS